MISQALGGVGLFLIGMILVTDGLRAAAGDALRHFLLRFTGGRLKSIATGAVTTALVQSSSATTVATIGFVGAGLIGDLQLADADRRLDAMRWLEETTHFLWRLCDRLSGERLLSPEAV